MRNVIRVLGAGVAGLIALSVVNPSFGARAIQGSVGEVSTTDALALGSVGFRIWSALPGGTTLTINNNVPSCRNLRCPRNYVTNTTLNPGGYVGNQEATQVYNGDKQDTPFYMLVDASMNHGAANHIGFWGVAGVTANNFGIGSLLADACGGTTVTNCFERLDSTHAAPPLTGATTTYGGPPSTIRAIAGLNPIPNVWILSATSTSLQLGWRDPPTYTAAMRPSTTAPAPPSPVKGVRLWKNERMGACIEPADEDPGWTSVGAFDLGNTTTQFTLNPAAACTFFALTVRLVGPGGGSAEIETGQQGSTHFVGVNSPPMPCNDGNPCTADFYDPSYGGCSSEPVEPGTPCATGCYRGVCGWAKCFADTPVVCTALDACHVAGTCDQATSLCSNPPAPDGTACNDGNLCTQTDACHSGACAGSPVVCDDANTCTDDACSPSTGQCVLRPRQGACDDGDPCTASDACTNGACIGAFTGPGEVPHFVWTPGSKDDMAWDAVPNTMSYRVYRGLPSSLPDLLNPAADSCTRLSTPSTSTGSALTEAPDPGTFFWYLVRAVTGTCEGPAGSATAGSRHQESNGACP